MATGWRWLGVESEVDWMSRVARIAVQPPARLRADDVRREALPVVFIATEEQTGNIYVDE